MGKKTAVIFPRGGGGGGGHSHTQRRDGRWKLKKKHGTVPEAMI